MENSKKLLTLFSSIWIMLLALTALPFMAAHAEAQKITLKYGDYTPGGTIDAPIKWYFDEVSKRSGVKIEFENYLGGILAKAPDCLDAIGKGVYDIGWISPVFTPAKTPLAMIPNATPLVAPTLFSAVKAANELVRTFPAAADEYNRSNVKILFHTGSWHYNLVSTKPVNSLGDIKGLRVRTFGYLSKVWADLGGVPVAISVAETYDALQKGAIDGTLTQPSSFKTLKLSEIAKHFIKLNLGCLAAPVLINMDSWNKLPEKVRREMINLESDMPKMVDQIISNQELKILEDLNKEGIKTYELPAADTVRIREVAKVITRIVIDDLTTKGVTNAKKAMDIYLADIGKYTK